MMQRYRDLIRKNKRHDLQIELRHVRSHTMNRDARSYVNEWCDKAAKEQMRTVLNTFN